MAVPIADSFPPGRPRPGAPGWPAPHREPPGYPAGPPSRVWTGWDDWPGGVYQRPLERRIVMASGLLDGPAASVLSAQLSGPALGVLAACGQRLGYPSAVLGLTEPALTVGGTASQVRAQEEQIETMVDTLYLRLAEVTGREVDEIRADGPAGPGGEHGGQH